MTFARQFAEAVEKRTATGVQMLVSLTGRPASGKTSLAHIYAEAMQNAGLYKNGSTVLAAYNLHPMNLTPAQPGYISFGNTDTLVDGMKKLGNSGVLIVDEIGHNIHHDQVMEIVLRSAFENGFDVIFTGAKDTLGDFMQRNPSLQSRFAAAVHLDMNERLPNMGAQLIDSAIARGQKAKNAFIKK